MDDEGDVREEGCIRRVWRVPRGHSPILRKHRFSSDTPRVLTTPLPYPPTVRCVGMVKGPLRLLDRRGDVRHDRHGVG